MMRTTLSIDDDVLSAARILAAERRLSLGAALSEMARRGALDHPSAIEGDLPVFDVGATAPLITPAMVFEADQE